jgi:copper resistance protein C
MRASYIRAASLFVVLMFWLPNVAWAHAFLDHSDPKVGSTVSTPPKEVRIWFTQEIEPAFSTIEVRDSSGKQVDKQDCRQDSQDKKLLIVSVGRLADGEYSVSWSVVSTDTHHTQGDFKFTVKAGS